MILLSTIRFTFNLTLRASGCNHFNTMRPPISRYWQNDEWKRVSWHCQHKFDRKNEPLREKGFVNGDLQMKKSFESIFK